MAFLCLFEIANFIVLYLQKIFLYVGLNLILLLYAFIHSRIIPANRKNNDNKKMKLPEPLRISNFFIAASNNPNIGSRIRVNVTPKIPVVLSSLLYLITKIFPNIIGNDTIMISIGKGSNLDK
jgi:hypothetical protein